jgi:hypothetical protein
VAESSASFGVQTAGRTEERETAKVRERALVTEKEKETGSGLASSRAKAWVEAVSRLGCQERLDSRDQRFCYSLK